MRNIEEIKALLLVAQELGLNWIEVDGVKLPVPLKPRAPSTSPKTDPIIYADPTADMTDEEILFYSTPYFDELQETKKKRAEAMKEEENLRSDS